jgi:trigger factor
MSNPDTDLAPDAPAAEEKKRISLEVDVKETSACERHITVTIPREDIERYFTEAFDDFQPKAEVPGFRPGRAPRKLVESRFREQMADQVKGSLLMDSVSQINEEAEFSAISEPDFDFEAIELPEEGPMTFEFDIEVRPEFEIPEWKGLQLTRPTHEYSDTEIDENLKRLLGRYGRMVDKDGPAEAGDHVKLHLRFRDGEQLVAEIKDETVPIRPKLSFRDANIEGFDELVLGAKQGEQRETKVTVGSDASNEKMRGKELDTQIDIVEVKRVKLPELTPAFLDEIGGFEDEDELRDAVRQELERQLAYHQQQQVRRQIAGVLTQSADWELPKDLLRRQARRELERAVLELRSSGFSEDMIRSYQNELQQNSLRTTERALKEHFILERIAEDVNLDATPEDFDTEVRLIAAQSQDSPRRVRARLEKRGQMDALRNQIIERKVVELITSHAQFTDTPFEPNKDETAAIDQSVSGHEEDEEIPEAKYGGEAEELPGTDAHG